MAPRLAGDNRGGRLWAQGAVLLALSATMALGWRGSQEVSAQRLRLEQLPRQVGEWRMESEETQLSEAGEYKLLRRTYADGRGQRLSLTVQGTCSRLGSLRNWPLAMVAQGWTAERRELRTIAAAGGGDQLEGRMEWLTNAPRRLVALSWYTSVTAQAGDYKRAQALAWRGRLLGSRQPWAGVYVTAAPVEGFDAQRAVEGFAAGLAAAVRSELSAARS